MGGVPPGELQTGGGDEVNGLLARALTSEEENHGAPVIHLDHVSLRRAVGWEGGVALAQDLDAKWLVGKWTSVAENPGDRRQTDRWELTMKPDGTFQGDVQTDRSGLIHLRNGSWKVDGATVILEAIFQGGPSHVNGSALKLTLKRAGDQLDGTMYRGFNNRTDPITLKKAP
jgi:hypothetical protein